MTGFGYSEQVTDEFSITAEMKSYNNRYLDLNINLPPVLSPLEEQVRKHLSEHISRGRVDVYIKMREFITASEIVVDEDAVKKHMQALQKLADIAGIDEKIHLSHLLRIDGLLKSYSIFDPDKYWNILSPILEDCLSKLDVSRVKEGKTIEKDVLGLIDALNKEVELITREVPKFEEKIKTMVTDKFREILENQVDENRVLQEIASLFIRYDINEELSRLSAHLKSFQDTIHTDTLVGRKLDFLCQELNREVNTIGSKSIVVAINNSVVNCKEVIERIREQLRNVE